MIQLIRNQIGIEPIFEGDFTQSKIIITPDIAKTRCKQGIVKQLGPKVEGDIKIGDYVLFGAYDGTIIADEDELIIIIPEDALDCKVMQNVKLDLYEFLVRGFDGELNPVVDFNELMKEVASQMRDKAFINAQPRKK